MFKKIVIGAALAASAVALVSASSSAGASAAAGSAPTGTIRTAAAVIRPVTAAGSPANGYLVAAYDTHASVRCYSVSAAAVDNNIASCVADGSVELNACWSSVKHSVLCLTSVSRKQLTRYRFGHQLSAVPGGRHLPEAVGLAVGGTCMVRKPVNSHLPTRPDFVDQFTCGKGNSLAGPKQNVRGIDYSVNPWRIYEVSRHDGVRRVTERRIAVAYYVGNAAR